MQDIIDNSLIEHEFETLWPQMIEKHHVAGVKVFDDMWTNRNKYVPVYFKTKNSHLSRQQLEVKQRMPCSKKELVHSLAY
jgi:hypothetical protein